MVCGAVDLIGRVMTIQAKVEVRLDLAEILKWISVLIWLFSVDRREPASAGFRSFLERSRLGRGCGGVFNKRRRIESRRLSDSACPYSDSTD